MNYQDLDEMILELERRQLRQAAMESVPGLENQPYENMETSMMAFNRELESLNAEISKLNAEISRLNAENSRLWILLLSSVTLNIACLINFYVLPTLFMNYQDLYEMILELERRQLRQAAIESVPGLENQPYENMETSIMAFNRELERLNAEISRLNAENSRLWVLLLSSVTLNIAFLINFYFF
jgi:uncharacterized small protein (DUF1192 family)/ribosomal protein S14